MKSKSFGSTLREIREDGSISLRSLAKESEVCLLYTSDAADDSLRVDLGGRRIIKKHS